MYDIPLEVREIQRIVCDPRGMHVLYRNAIHEDADRQGINISAELILRTSYVAAAATLPEACPRLRPLVNEERGTMVLRLCYDKANDGFACSACKTRLGMSSLPSSQLGTLL